MKPRSALNKLEPYIPGKTISGGIKLSSNENPLGSSPRALEAIRDASALNRYPDGGMHRLKERLAQYWGADPQMFVVGNGSDEIMVMIAGTFMEPGLNAVTALHTFSQYTFATTIFGGQMRYADMPEGRFDLPAIRELTDRDTRLVYLCNPNNPTATAFTHDDLQTFLRRVPEHVVVVVDEAYGEFADASEYPRTMELIARFPNLIRLRTFSKIYGLAGLRIGYGTAQSDLIRVVSRLRQPFNVGTIAQEAAAAALDDREFVERSIANTLAGRDRICNALDQLGIDYYRSHANFVCADFGSNARTVVQQLADRRITVRPLDSFGLPDHIRISVGTPEEVAAVCEALAEAAAQTDALTQASS
ncbi:MAG: histidinol-phosphate transaminase [Spirochaetia bacterium]